MNELIRREWGAVAFLVATALGIIVVPVGLNLNKRNVPAATESLIGASPSPIASPGASPAAAPATAPSAAPAAPTPAAPAPGQAPAPTDTPTPAPSPS